MAATTIDNLSANKFEYVQGDTACGKSMAILLVAQYLDSVGLKPVIVVHSSTVRK